MNEPIKLNRKKSRQKIWVFAPFTSTSDSNLEYYCDYSQSLEEYEKVFSKLNMEWAWKEIRLDNIDETINDIRNEHALTGQTPVVLNLCDGDEINGAPGISVIKKLEKHGMIYTGADAAFFEITTSKIPMKQAFDSMNLPTPEWEAIGEVDETIFERLGRPIIVKPAVSGGSMGVGTKNVVYDLKQLTQVISEIRNGYRGWNLTIDGIIAEKYIAGREFTVLISGSCDKPKSAHIFPAVERVFHPSLPPDQRFLSFDRLWEIYEEETSMPGQDNFYEYAAVEQCLQDELKGLSWAAFCSTAGKGYTRVDIRQDEKTGKLFVLEVNAQCGISEDENYTSIGAILRFSGTSFHELIQEIIRDANQRAVTKPNLVNVAQNKKARA